MSQPDFTVLGCDGNIGGALTVALRLAGSRVRAVNRDGLPDWLASGRLAGHVISCIGLTGDFRTRPLDAAEAHVGVTARCLAASRAELFLYLSSTRVYAAAATTNEEACLSVSPAVPSDLYNLTKLTGEALCLADPRSGVRVARLSNVYSANPGAGTFLGQIIAAGRAFRSVRFQQAPESEKDYISLADVVTLLPAIAISGQQRLYNLASGRNTRHGDIAAALSASLGWHTEFSPDGPTIRFPPIDISRLRAEFQAPAGVLIADLAGLAAGSTVLVREIIPNEK